MSFGQFVLDSFILCSDLAAVASFAALVTNVQKERSAKGISAHSIIALSLGQFLHIFSHALNMHYRPSVLPYFVYALIDLAKIGACGYACYLLVVSPLSRTVEWDRDNMGHTIGTRAFRLIGLRDEDPGVQKFLRAGFLYLMTLLGAFVWYWIRRSQQPFMKSMFTCYYEVLVAVGLLPQLWMFQRDKRVTKLMGYFVVGVAVQRTCTMLFWLLYPSLVLYGRYPDNRGVAMASELLNLLILADFLYYFARSHVRGDKDIVVGDPLGSVL